MRSHQRLAHGEAVAGSSPRHPQQARGWVAPGSVCRKQEPHVLSSVPIENGTSQDRMPATVTHTHCPRLAGRLGP